MIRAFSRLSLAVALLLVATLAFGWWRVDGPGGPGSDLSRTRPMPLGAMEFSLFDQNGDAVGPDTLRGRPSMVFFGFTHCPDVCPTTLADISDWLDELGPDAERMNVVFITVDPERDTAPAMAEYVSAFDPLIQGWTGAQDEIAKAADEFRVRYEKLPRDGGDYTINHTASVLLYGAAGDFLGTVDYHEPPDYAVPKIRRALRTLSEQKPS